MKRKTAVYILAAVTPFRWRLRSDRGRRHTNCGLAGKQCGAGGRSRCGGWDGRGRKRICGRRSVRRGYGIRRRRSGGHG